MPWLYTVIGFGVVLIFVYYVMKLRQTSKMNRIQSLMQLHDRQFVSERTILEEMELDYSREVERLREERTERSSGHPFDQKHLC